ncbi:MAG: hypothetical protein M3198_12940 [Actinomycetota bacterium]|nr:hypothetical protein [Actinomycetota bacterium]
MADDPRQMGSGGEAAPAETSVRQGPGVALLLTAAAVVAALIGGRASALSASAATSWQEATREKVKEAAAYVEQIRYVYGVEVPRALSFTGVRFRIEELDKLIDEKGLSPSTVSFLKHEKATQAETLKQVLPASELASNPQYRTEAGFDPLRMLGDERASRPEFLELDPERLQDQGSETGDRAIQMIASAIPVSIGFFCGSLARAFARRKRVWLGVGTVFLIMGIASAVVVEVA